MTVTWNGCHIESVSDHRKALKFEVVSNPQMKRQSFNSLVDVDERDIFESVQRCPSSFEDILCYSDDLVRISMDAMDVSTYQPGVDIQMWMATCV